MHTVIFKDFRNDLFVWLNQNNEDVKAFLNWYLDQSCNMDFETVQRKKITIIAGSIVSIEIK